MSSGREVKVFSRMRASICFFFLGGEFKLNRCRQKRSVRTFDGFLLAKSMATAPPIDCPKRIYENF